MYLCNMDYPHLLRSAFDSSQGRTGTIGASGSAAGPSAGTGHAACPTAELAGELEEMHVGSPGGGAQVRLLMLRLVVLLSECAQPASLSAAVEGGE